MIIGCWFGGVRLWEWDVKAKIRVMEASCFHNYRRCFHVNGRSNYVYMVKFVDEINNEKLWGQSCKATEQWYKSCKLVYILTQYFCKKQYAIVIFACMLKWQANASIKAKKLWYI